MAAGGAVRAAGAPLPGESPATREPALARWLLIGFTALFLGTLLVMPLLVVLGQAFAQGVKLWLASLSDPDARAAIRLTLMTAAIVVPLNTAFGVAAAW